MGANLELLKQLDGFENDFGSAFDLEELAAVHFDLFQIQVAPYESIFLDDAGMVGGAIAEAVMDANRNFGCVVEANEFSLDHVGNELKVLSNLCLAAQLASSRNSQTELARAEQAQQEFLHTHLLRWIHPFVLVVRSQPVALFPGLAELLLECLHEHAESFAEMLPARSDEQPENEPSPRFSSARKIAHWLSLPCQCGFFLDKRTITALGRSAGLPSGFGTRQDMMENLFESAAHYSSVPHLVENLKSLGSETEAAYREFSEKWPASKRHLDHWISLTTQTMTLLDELISPGERADETDV